MRTRDVIPTRRAHLIRNRPVFANVARPNANVGWRSDGSFACARRYSTVFARFPNRRTSQVPATAAAATPDTAVQGTPPRTGGGT